MNPYYKDKFVTLYHGDALKIAPRLGIKFDAILADPPYNETDLEWDKWPRGWPAQFKELSNQMWCFGSMKMFMNYRDDFDDWKLAQDLVWEKHNGSGLMADRFRRVHELTIHWYQGTWKEVFKNIQFVEVKERDNRKNLIRGRKPQHWGGLDMGRGYDYDGKRLTRSVIYARSCHGYAVNETQKPASIAHPILNYSVPAGGIILDPFAGSGTFLDVARQQHKRAIGIEKRKSQCEQIVKRLSQLTL
jgi:site-specific DNA-methyltransferase (adenine-specific)